MLTRLSASEIAAQLRSKQVSAREVAQAHLERIRELDDRFGCYLTVDEERALADADRAQAMLDKGEGGPLTGVPVAVKDNISTRGIRTTCASRILENYIPPYDAHVVESMNAEGMVMLGKTNLDEFAMGTSTENSAYQVTRNPWDTDRVPGGSSGGSAAAVAAELAPISLGSDTGGSIRQPAALCGIVGFKPTYGRVSRYGLVAFGSSLDQIGPFGRTVEDVALAASAVSGHDDHDSTSLSDSKIRTDELKNGSLKGLKVGLPRETFSEAVEPGVRAALEQSIETLQSEGVEFKEISLPLIARGITTYYIIAPAEASSNLGRYDGVRYGPRESGQGHIGAVAATRGKLFGHEVKQRIMIGTYALSAGYYDAYYLRAQQVRALMSAEFEKAFAEFDCVMSPTSPCVAFPLGGLVKDPLAMKLLDFCTIPANMGGFPSLSLPCGLSEGLPVGMLITGPVMSDERLLQMGCAIEAALPNSKLRPPIP